MKTELINYFSSIDPKRKTWKVIKNPFESELVDTFDETQEEFLKLKFDLTATDNFTELDLEAFLAKYLAIYSLISTQAFRDLTIFGLTYLCEAAFSALIAIKTKYRNKQQVEGDLRLTLSGIKPCIKELVAKKQC